MLQLPHTATLPYTATFPHPTTLPHTTTPLHRDSPTLQLPHTATPPYSEFLAPRLTQLHHREIKPLRFFFTRAKDPFTGRVTRTRLQTLATTSKRELQLQYFFLSLCYCTSLSRSLLLLSPSSLFCLLLHFSLLRPNNSSRISLFACSVTYHELSITRVA